MTDGKPTNPDQKHDIKKSLDALFKSKVKKIEKKKDSSSKKEGESMTKEQAIVKDNTNPTESKEDKLARKQLKEKIKNQELMALLEEKLKKRLARSKNKEDEFTGTDKNGIKFVDGLRVYTEE